MSTATTSTPPPPAVVVLLSPPPTPSVKTNADEDQDASRRGVPNEDLNKSKKPRDE